MARKSPFDVRSVDPAIVEIILGELVKAGGKIALSSIDDALRSERFAGRIESRMSRKTSTASDELVELAWFGLIDVKDGFILSKVNMEDLRRYLENDLRGNLERSYYSMEVLYRLMIDSLIRNGGRMPEHSLLEEISDSLVDPRQYPGYGFQVEGPVQIRFNQAKMFFLVRVGRKLGRIQREGSDILLVEKDADLRVIILRSYEAVSRGLTSMEFLPLWAEVQSRDPSAARESFDKALLELRDLFFPDVDLFQASGSITIKDPLTEKYYHHVRIELGSIRDMINTLRSGGIR